MSNLGGFDSAGHPFKQVPQAKSNFWNRVKSPILFLINSAPEFSAVL